MPRRAAAVLALLGLAACAGPQASSPPPLPAAAPAALCSGAGISIRTGFDQAALHGCEIAADGHVRAEIRPEIQPINPSPWYAFEVQGPAGARPMLTLAYPGARHRYDPWVKRGAGIWQRVPPPDVQLLADGSASIRLPPLAGPLLVAAQPLDDTAAALAPFEAAVAAGTMQRLDTDKTPDGRALPVYLHRPPGARGLVVLVGRQHPPEKTGAAAFDALAREILSDDPLMQRLRRDVAILWVPVMNPDGIARGNWRGNSRGADLNRDWGLDAQPEVAAVSAQVQRLAGSLPLLAVMDLHSTRTDILYAPTEGLVPTDAGERFTRAFAAETGVQVSRAHNPEGGTLKAWALEQFGVSGLTYEVGDATDAQALAANARTAARLLAEAILATPAPTGLSVPRSLAQAGVRRFAFTAWPGPPIPVWSLRPPSARADAPLLFVMHGVGRDADRYIGEWVDIARAEGLVLVVPEFTREGFPGADGYNNGGMTDAQGKPRPRAIWAYSAIEPIFDAVRAREKLTTPRYILYGHSAGAQFAHRFVLTGNPRRMQQAIVANAGSYAFPTDSIEWPFGMGGLPPGSWNADAAFRQPMTLLLGTADNDPAHRSLPAQPGAKAQGPHRLARGQAFFAEAVRQGGPALAWRCALAPGVGHDNGRMAPFALTLIRTPAAVAPARPCAPIAPITAGQR
jgi:poly(3-hydroxybutyrate) depolymerase